MVQRQIILDTETTGLEPSEGHRIIEVAAVELINRRFTGNYFHQYINPQRKVEEGALNVHGISEQFLSDKPKFAEIAKPLMDYIDGSELIIHNAPFDVGFLDNEFKLTGEAFRKITECCNVVDTLVLARQLHPGQKNSLDALCKRYQVDNSRRDWHGALIDAELLGWVYLAMTGGQISLFGTMTEEGFETSEKGRVSRTLIRQKGTIPIIRATIEELAEHEKYMEGL